MTERDGEKTSAFLGAEELEKRFAELEQQRLRALARRLAA